jgi:hypothetical protein
VSFIRIVRPGHPVDSSLFIDLGPHSRGRVSVSPFSSMGSAIEPDASKATKQSQHMRNFRARRELGPDSCGLLMPKGSTCVLIRDHLSHCRSKRSS